MKDRKAFHFYRSYYDVIVELPDEQKLPLLMAILDKQFLDVEPQLTGLPALLYKSQKHSIEKQVNGYKSKMGISTPTEGPTQGPCQGPTEGPCQQEEEKGQEQEKGQVQGEEQQKNELVKKKYELKEQLKTIFKTINNVDKLIDRNDMDTIERSDKHLFNIHYQTILEYQAIKL